MSAVKSPGVVTRRPRAVLRRPRVPRRWRKPLLITGAVIIGIWVLVAVLSPWISPDNPLAQNATPLSAPSAHHLFGTDESGRDVLSRVLSGARVSLPLGILLVVLELVIGGSLGAIAGYFGGWVDEIIMRITDLVFAFPTILLAMVVVAALGSGLSHSVIAVAAVGWPVQARVVRSLVRSTMQSDYVAVSRLLGSSSARALRVDVVRNVLGPVAVLATLGVGNAILLLSGLSFLGLGARPPMAEWGSMVATGSLNFQDWWLATFPGLAILTVVMGFNFLGDGLRDALDPRSFIDEALPGVRAVEP
jgi:ABC-type dipeptide/oligopeptide/nickel transport system permease subunit